MYVLYLALESLQTGPVAVEVAPVEPHYIRKGAVINALNPHPYLFWVTVGAPFMIKAWQEDRLSPWFFLGAFYLFLVGSKAFLAVIVGKSRSFLMSRGYVWMMRVLGGLLGLFALILMRDALVFWGFWGSFQ
jgi:threonine/homoserine/homoserine lactone efflux protein